jgi:DNA-binding XRE family transcriptional regulator
MTTPKQLRAATGLSQVKFAEAIQLCPRTIYNIETGVLPINSAYLAWIRFYGANKRLCIKEIKQLAYSNAAQQKQEK